MAGSVFISYAAEDPDWPEATVRALALALKHRGAAVLLDLWHPPALGRIKLSPDEWRRWMKACISDADRVICLASLKYVQAAERDIREEWGYGVAYESLRMIHKIYQNKGHNDGWILVALKDSADAHKCVPDEFQFSCPQFRCPQETPELIADAIRVAVDAPVHLKSESKSEKLEYSILTSSESLVVESLNDAPQFLRDVVDDACGRRIFQEDRMPRDAVSLVNQLGACDKQVAQKVMLAVRRVLLKYSKSNPKLSADISQAAVRLYMLCGTRWVRTSALKCTADTVVKVPDMLLNPIAVLSATLFGGSVLLH